MNRTEREKIYRLLSNFYPNAKQLQSRETLTAYGLALERYSYEDVKRAVVNYATHNKFFPDLSDLLEGVPSGSTAEYWEDLAFSKPWHLCRVLVAGRETGGTFGDMLARYAPAACEDCPRRSGCHNYQSVTKGFVL